MTPWYVWAFDGVGGAAIVAACIAVYQRYSVKREQAEGRPLTIVGGTNSSITSASPISASLSGPVSDSQVAVGNNISQSVEVHHHYGDPELAPALQPTTPSPEQICAAIFDATPFDRQHTRDKYQGIEVVWRTQLFGISREDDRWHLHCLSNAFVPSVFCYLSSIPPELKLAASGAVIWLRGKIREADMTHITLETDPDIRIEPPTSANPKTVS
jgi:hypothetical protein